MKKWLIGVPIVIAVIFISIVLSIPERLKVSEVRLITCTIKGLSRQLLVTNNWAKWWPEYEAATGQNSSFQFKGYSFRITRYLSNGLDIEISRNKLRIQTNIELIPQSRESIKATWRCSFIASTNVVEKIRRYQQARGVKNVMGELLDTLQRFSENTSNIYGIEITQIISKDSTLVGTRRVVATYPGVSVVYPLIDTLRQYIQSRLARQTDSPMLHVRKINPGYEVMVAIPVNRPLPGNGNIFNSRFVPWKTLVGEVRGGFYSVDSAYTQMQHFIDDYQRTSMAIPFELLVTNRQFETDTSKWVTRICQPVF